MTYIINITVESDGKIGYIVSAGLPEPLALAAVQAVERELQRRVARAELEAERAKEREE